MADHVHCSFRFRPSMRCRKWWAKSRARVRSILRVSKVSAAVILWGIAYGHGAIFVSTVGRDETTMVYIRHQEAEYRRLNHMDLWR
jgi:hypothetical protein